MNDSKNEFINEDFVKIKKTAERLLGEVGQFFESIYSDHYRPVTKDEIGTLKRQVSAAVLEVFCTGNQRIGKSTLLNAILGSDAVFAKSGGVTTAALTMWKYGEKPQARVIFRDPSRTEQTFDPSDMEKMRYYTSAKSDLDPASKVDRVEVCVPDDSLRGLCFIDAPGLGDIDNRRSEIARNFSKTCHALVYAMSAEANGSIHDMEFLREFRGASIAKEWTDTFILLLRSDQLYERGADHQLTDHNIEEVAGDVARVFRQQLGMEESVFSSRFYAVSARWARYCQMLDAKQKTFASLKSEDLRFWAETEQQLRTVAASFVTFRNALRQHLSKPEIKNKIFLLPMRRLQRDMQDAMAYLSQVLKDLACSEGELKTRIQEYSLMIEKIEIKAYDLGNKVQADLVALEKETVDFFDASREAIAHDITKKAQESLKNALASREVTSKEAQVDSHAKLDKLLESISIKVAGDVQQDGAKIIEENLTDQFAKHYLTLESIAGKAFKQAKEFLEEGNLGEVFKEFKFAEIENIDRVISEVLGDYLGSIESSSHLFKTVQEGGYTFEGAGAGAVIGGTVGFLIGGPLGAGIGALIGGGGGATAGNTMGTKKQVLDKDWKAKLIADYEKKVYKSVLHELDSRRPDLIGAPLMRVKKRFKQRCINVLKVKAKEYLENMRVKLQEVTSQHHDKQKATEQIHTRLQEGQNVLTDISSIITAIEVDHGSAQKMVS